MDTFWDIVDALGAAGWVVLALCVAYWVLQM